MAKKFSQFPAASSISPGDSVVGLQDGENTRFPFATFLSSIQSLFVPTSRKINNKALSSDITLDASDVGAVDASDVGVADGVASLDSNGKVPSGQLPPISSDADDITYDPTASGASTTNVQDALDEAFDALDGKQGSITASGILKGDGAGGVSAATPGTDYATPSQLATVGIFYGSCSTAAGTQNKEATVNGVTELFDGLFVRIEFKYAQDYNGTPTLNINNLGAYDMYRSSAVMTRYAWPNGAIIDFVYSNAKWITVSGSVATTTNYGITRLYSNVNSNSTSVAATASAVKTAYDLAAGKANQSQLAYVETGTTASRAYAVGEYFCWNNLLYRAKTAISSGGTFTPGTNCEQTTVTTQLSKMYAENGEYSVSSGVLRFQGTSPVELGATVVASITRTDSGIWNQYVVYPRILARHDLAFYFRQATDGTNAPNGIYGLSFLIINP